MAPTVSGLSAEDTMSRIGAAIDSLDVSRAEKKRLSNELRVIFEMHDTQAARAPIDVESEKRQEPLIGEPLTDAIFADAYRNAALTGSDMTETAAALEQIRTASQDSLDPFEAWDVLDDSIGAAFGAPRQQTLLALREHFVSRVTATSCADISSRFEDDRTSATSDLIGIIAEAIAEWRLSFAATLARLNIAAAPELADTVSMIRECAPMALHQRWAEAFPMYAKLGQLDFLPVTLRARLLNTAGEIQQHHFQKSSEKNLIEQAYSLAPDLPDVLCGMGMLRFVVRDFAEAADFARKAIDKRQDHVNAHTLLGEIASATGAPDEAEEHYQNAIRLRPGEPTPYQMLIRLAGERPPTYIRQRVQELYERGTAVRPEFKAMLLVEAGYALERNGHREDALDYYQRAIATAPENPTGYVYKGNTLIGTGDAAGAEHIFEALAKFDPPHVDGYFGLGAVSEMNTDFGQAERWYLDGVQEAPYRAGQLSARAAYAIWKQDRQQEAEDVLLREIAAWPKDEVILETAERVAQELLEQNSERAKSFYDGIFAAAGEGYEARYFCKLADVAVADGDQKAAASSFARAREIKPDDPDIFRSEASALRRLQAWQATRTLYSSAPEHVKNDTAFRKEMALLRNAEANRMYEASHYADAITLYQEAVEHNPTDAVLFTNLAGAYERATDWPDPAERWERATEATQRAHDLSPNDPEIASDLKRLSRVSRFVRDFGKCAEHLPVVTPIAIEVAYDLIHYFEGDAGQLAAPFAELITEFRERMFSEQGLRLPSVRVRGNETDMPQSSYLILIDEVPIVMGTLQDGMRFSPLPSHELQAAGLSVVPGTDPLTGREGSFVSEADWPSAEANNIELWGFLEYITRHLQSVIESKPKTVIGHQEVVGLLWQTKSETAKRVRQDPELLTAFTLVLKALAEERVPIAAIDELCVRFVELREASTPLDLIPQELRLIPEIRSRLVDSDGDLEVFATETPMENLLRQGLHREADRTQLALRPEDCQEVLSAVRDKVPSMTPAALIVQDPDVRALAQELLEIEFPRLRVLAERELDLAFMQRNRTVIDFDWTSNDG
ncbi:MAG: FHIPEP family type III secretion protein [Pseudomonadota bacterium]